MRNIITNYKICLVVLVFCFGCLLSVNAQSSKDVIAIRVIPNTEHYSPSRWYEEQGFTGSPQSLLVDGYEAIRDGRTVYVNAANIDTSNGYCSEDASTGCAIPSDTCETAGKGVCVPKIYTNIYLISYNQEAESQTLDIFGNILNNWKFNTNINGKGKCENDKTRSCTIDSNCDQGVYCRKLGKCGSLDPASPDCFFDSDCAPNTACVKPQTVDALVKAELVRDTKRLSQLADLKTILNNYGKPPRNAYPALNSGTYLPNITISTWPSWQQNLGSELGATLPKDPINQLGKCEGYNPVTCWDELNKKFAGSIDANGNIIFPTDSYALAYSSNYNGSLYRVCAIMESGLVTKFEEGACSGSAASITAEYSAEAINYLPTIESYNFPNVECSRYNYSGFVRAADKNNDIFIWNIAEKDNAGNINNGYWTSKGWSGFLQIENISDINSKKFTAAYAGGIGDYKFDVSITDGRSNPITNSYSISVVPAQMNLQTITLPATIEITYGTVASGQGFTLPIKDPNYHLNFDISNIDEDLSADADLNTDTDIRVVNNTLIIEIDPTDPAIANAKRGNTYNFKISGVKDNCDRWLNGIIPPNNQLDFDIQIKNNPPNPPVP